MRMQPRAKKPASEMILDTTIEEEEPKYLWK